VAAPVITYASAIALDELAISAAAGAHSPSSLPHRETAQFRAAQNVRFRLQTVQRNTEIVNESERKLYLVVLVVVGAAGEKSTMEILKIKSESAICACLVRAYGKPRDTLTSTGSFRGP
jgi:hypothetical protein